MTLSLGVHAGSQMDIGPHRLSVDKVTRGVAIDVTVDGKKFRIVEDERTKVLPDVYLSYGLPSGKDPQSAARLAIEAPRSIPIHRVGTARA